MAKVVVQKGHGRMILGCDWAPLLDARQGDDEGGDSTTEKKMKKRYVFATAGRDKCVKIWEGCGTTWTAVRTLATEQPVTAVAFFHAVVGDGRAIVLAAGLEQGDILVYVLGVESGGLEEVRSTKIPAPLAPRESIKRLAWRPRSCGYGHDNDDMAQLAIASEDHSVRIAEVALDAL